MDIDIDLEIGSRTVQQNMGCQVGVNRSGKVAGSNP
jgi:hypothetical protein